MYDRSAGYGETKREPSRNLSTGREHTCYPPRVHDRHPRHLRPRKVRAWFHIELYGDPKTGTYATDANIAMRFSAGKITPHSRPPSSFKTSAVD